MPPRDRARVAQRVRKLRLEIARSKGTHTDGQWASLLEEVGGRCVICEAIPPSLSKDHITPIYQGGSDAIENIQPLCRACNSAKGPDTFNWLAFRRVFGFSEAS